MQQTHQAPRCASSLALMWSGPCFRPGAMTFPCHIKAVTHLFQASDAEVRCRHSKCLKLPDNYPLHHRTLWCSVKHFAGILEFGRYFQSVLRIVCKLCKATEYTE